MNILFKNEYCDHLLLISMAVFNFIFHLKIKKNVSHSVICKIKVKISIYFNLCKFLSK